MNTSMSVTNHVTIKETWKKTKVHECLPFKEKHSSENLIKALQSAFQEHGI